MFKTVALAFLLVALNAAHAEDEWVEAPSSYALPGDTSGGKTYFSPHFERKSGTFRAMFESILDQRDSISGTFLTGRFRYVYPKPIDSGSRLVPKHDESITTALLDCKNNLFGTLNISYRLKGKLVRDVPTPDREVQMVHASQGTVVGLCDFAKKRGAL